MFTVGGVDRYVDRYIGRQSIDSRSIVDRQSVNSRSTFGRVSENEHVEKFTGLFPEYRNLKQREKGNKMSNRMHKQRRKNTRSRRNKAQLEANKIHIKNLSNKQLTGSQINLLAKGLKFIPTPVRLDNNSCVTLNSSQEECVYNTCTTLQKNWNPPVQHSVALKSYFEEVKLLLVEINPNKPKNNLPPAECEAVRALKGEKQINLRKADKGTNTVVMNKDEKINKGQIQLNVRKHYSPSSHPWQRKQENEF